MGNMAALRNMFTFSARSVVGARCLYNSNIFNQKSALSSVGKDPTSLDEEEPLKISKAMKSYITRANAHDEFMKQQLSEYRIGKRHLANMMGKDPETFSQDDVNEAIKYLFPSGLYDPRAKPMMKHPDEIFPSKKAAEFDIHGRPYHTKFYTAKPNYYSLLHDAAEKLKSLNAHQDRMKVPPTERSFLAGSEWLTKMSIENILMETINDVQFSTLVNMLERCAQHPYAYKEKACCPTLNSNRFPSLNEMKPDGLSLYLTERGKEPMHRLKLSLREPVALKSIIRIFSSSKIDRIKSR